MDGYIGGLGHEGNWFFVVMRVLASDAYGQGVPAAADDHQTSDLDLVDGGLHDVELLKEIQLMSDLMVAASSTHHGRLQQHAIDAILGLQSPESASPQPGQHTGSVPQPRPPQDEHP